MNSLTHKKPKKARQQGAQSIALSWDDGSWENSCLSFCIIYKVIGKRALGGEEAAWLLLMPINAN